MAVWVYHVLGIKRKSGGLTMVGSVRLLICIANDIHSNVNVEVRLLGKLSCSS